jgi:hypothetical protein
MPQAQAQAQAQAQVVARAGLAICQLPQID